MVAKPRNDLYVAVLKYLPLRPRIAAGLPVLHSIVAEEVVHHRFAMYAIHRILEPLRVMVGMVVRNQREIEQRRKFLRSPVMEIDGKQPVGRLDDNAHIVKVPYRRPVQILDHGMAHLVIHLGKRFFKPADRRISAFHFTQFGRRNIQSRFAIPDKKIRHDVVDLLLPQIVISDACRSMILPPNALFGQRCHRKRTCGTDELFSFHGE